MGTTPDRQYGRELATEGEVDEKLRIHRDATLLHEIDRDAAVDVVRDGAGRVQFVRHRDGVGGPPIRELELARGSDGRVLAITERQFDPPGALARTRMLTLARADGRVTGGSITTS